MSDFDSLFVDNLAEFQPVLMQTQYSGRDTVGRARSSGSLERTGSGSPSNAILSPPLPRTSALSNKLSQQRPTSLPSAHRRQASTGGQLSTSAPNNDPFGEIMSDFWPDHGISPHDSPDPSESLAPPMHTDRLLSFRIHQPPNVMLLDAINQPLNVKIGAQLHGMFFLAESPWDAAGNANTAPGGAALLPKELTCYRRNLFQVSGSLSIPHIASVVMTEEGTEMTLDIMANGKRRLVQSLEATISGIESVEFSPVKIITVPWKSAAANAAQQTQQTQTHSSNEEFPPVAGGGRSLEKEPLSLLFNYPPAYYANPVGIPPEEEADSFKYPLSWKRLQFRSATANNGRRKDLQQHFLVKITILATLFPENVSHNSVEKLDKVAICEAYSGPIIVRGRSPRNFSSRNDIPLTGSAIVSSRHNSNSTPHSSGNSSAPKKARHLSSSSIPPHDEEQKPNIQQLHMQDQAYNLTQSQPQEYLPNPLDGTMLPVGLNFTPNSIWSTENNWIDVGPTTTLSMQPLSQQAGMVQSTTAGTDFMQPYAFDPTGYTDLNNPSPRLSLSGMLPSGDFTTHPPTSQPPFYNTTRVTNQENSMPPPPPHISHRPSIPRVTSAQSPSMDLLYEYFPIGIDDWLPPVDVVYRPHNAHHQTQLPTKGNSRSKRLFSETPFE